MPERIENGQCSVINPCRLNRRAQWLVAKVQCWGVSHLAFLTERMVMRAVSLKVDKPPGLACYPALWVCAPISWVCSWPPAPSGQDMGSMQNRLVKCAIGT